MPPGHELAKVDGESQNNSPVSLAALAEAFILT
jgi:hypothetical protein